jgi:hypothetical protein
MERGLPAKELWRVKGGERRVSGLYNMRKLRYYLVSIQKWSFFLISERETQSVRIRVKTHF